VPYWGKTVCTAANPYSLFFNDPKDVEFMGTYKSLKLANPNLRVVLSVGGWGFPSAYFSEMAASPAGVSAFVTSVKALLTQYDLDGIDIDWEFPNSKPRTNNVKMSCDHFETYPDAGGHTADLKNFPVLLAALRTGLGASAHISFAGAPWVHEGMDMKAVAASVDVINVMAYDYFVPGGQNFTAPNAPLYASDALSPIPNPIAIGGVSPMSVNETIHDFIQAGVPLSKLVLGLALYGHTWYNPTAENTTGWDQFGDQAAMGKCLCGPDKLTWGAPGGKFQNACGQMMYSEILGSGCASGAHSYHDNATNTDIAYCADEADVADNHTAVGTWISYTGVESTKALVSYAKTMGLRGVFVFDLSQDTIAADGSAFTYELTMAASAALRSED
jgi:chitinase